MTPTAWLCVVTNFQRARDAVDAAARDYGLAHAGAYCMEEAALMSRVNVENCIRDSTNPEEECDVPPKYQELMDRIIQKKPKPQGPAPTVTVVDSEGSFEEYIGRPL